MQTIRNRRINSVRIVNLSAEKNHYLSTEHCPTASAASEKMWSTRGNGNFFEFGGIRKHDPRIEITDALSTEQRGQTEHFVGSLDGSTWQ